MANYFQHRKDGAVRVAGIWKSDTPKIAAARNAIASWAVGTRMPATLESALALYAFRVPDDVTAAVKTLGMGWAGNVYLMSRVGMGPEPQGVRR